jgi:hypothetical protein
VTEPDFARDGIESRMSAPYFQRDESRFVPTPFGRGGWGPSLSGHVVGGLLGWAVESAVDDVEFQPARLTVDLPRPTALEPIDLRVNVQNESRRLRLVEAVLTQNEVAVARGSALFLRRGTQPDGQVWSQPIQMPPVPDREGAYPTLFMKTYGWGTDLQNPDPDWPHASGPKYTWLHERPSLIDDIPMTPFVRAAMAGDITASIANWGSNGLQFINADYTLTLSRLPEGPHIGLVSHTHYSNDGVATGTATLVDPKGPIGSAVSVAIAHSGFRPSTAGPSGGDGR